MISLFNNNFDANRNFTDLVYDQIGTASGKSIEFASNFIKNFDDRVIN
jgi:hypothetical protein